VREAIAMPKGKTMTDAVDAPRERIGRAIFARWKEQDFEELARLLRKFTADIESHTPGKRLAPIDESSGSVAIRVSLHRCVITLWLNRKIFVV